MQFEKGVFGKSLMQAAKAKYIEKLYGERTSKNPVLPETSMLLEADHSQPAAAPAASLQPPTRPSGLPTLPSQSAKPSAPAPSIRSKMDRMGPPITQSGVSHSHSPYDSTHPLCAYLSELELESHRQITLVVQVKLNPTGVLVFLVVLRHPNICSASIYSRGLLFGTLCNVWQQLYHLPVPLMQLFLMPSPGRHAGVSMQASQMQEGIQTAGKPRRITPQQMNGTPVAAERMRMAPTPVAGALLQTLDLKF